MLRINFAHGGASPRAFAAGGVVAAPMGVMDWSSMAVLGLLASGQSRAPARRPNEYRFSVAIGEILV